MAESPDMTAEPVGTPETAPVETAPVVDADPFEVADTTTFSRDYVAKVRSESAKYRTRAKELEATAKPYEEVFGKYDADDRAVWFQLAKTYMDDPKAAAAHMRQIAEDILKGDEPDPEADTPLTKAEFEKRLNEREEERGRQAAVKAIQSEAEGLGYTKDSRAYKTLLLTAREDTNGDLKAAHELLQSEKQAAVDEFIARKAKEAEESPVAPGASGTAPSQAKEIKSWDDADDAFDAMLDQLRSK